MLLEIENDRSNVQSQIDDITNHLKRYETYENSDTMHTLYSKRFDLKIKLKYLDFKIEKLKDEFTYV